MKKRNLFGAHFANHVAKTAKVDEMYDSDLTDSEWELVEHFFDKKDNRGTKPIHKRRDIVNALLYVVKSGIQWRMLPKDFAPWNTVYDYYSQWSRDGVWSKALDAINELHRKKTIRRAPLHMAS